MPTKPSPQITAWSYSRLSTYEDCPFKAKMKYVDKAQEPGSKALDRGKAIHKIAEDYALGRIEDEPPELQCFIDEFKELRANKKRIQVEEQLALDKDWEPCDWFGPDAWVRLVVDCIVQLDTELILIDHKTGKIRPSHRDQLELYAIAGFANSGPAIKTIRGELWYLDQGELIEASYKRSDVPKLQKKWEKRAMPMLTDRTFKPKPGDGCRWCHFSVKRAGPCVY